MPTPKESKKRLGAILVNSVAPDEFMRAASKNFGTPHANPRSRSTGSNLDLESAFLEISFDKCYSLLRKTVAFFHAVATYETHACRKPNYADLNKR